ncbi:hypothetical protein KAFR_0B02880 [Kazachstania africana CBS 2517]|uniref:Uncharacterized protein n=1 Tax=Kazachstania africana (strain ATCC 22294 / BCRC 22015 / CBS 2517 / CECT 1963 / NBRC 1671 / NRRL Y-8276) TaxID=1071382 RepID=H2AQD5_KAZAF|nr:hypothetical protein KAFR_0B02880 [Kazachstania africana CBS 2517]CCF56585.1 hypothetical protein KAFR_0B02880 [Kazachstania africana CBS 2517]
MAAGNGSNYKARLKKTSSLFELPPFSVSWTSSRSKKGEDGNISSLLTTPLRRPRRGPVRNSRVEQEEKMPEKSVPTQYDIDTNGFGLDNPNEANIAYDYSPFSDKKSLCKTRIENYLFNERSLHVLTFHKHFHTNLGDSESFRPDIHWDCGNDDDEAENGSILIDYPESFNFEIGDPKNRHKEVLKFLNYSNLFNEYSYSEKRTRHRDLLKEHEELIALRRELKENPIKSLGSLEEKCHYIYKKDQLSKRKKRL